MNTKPETIVADITANEIFSKAAEEFRKSVKNLRSYLLEYEVSANLKVGLDVRRRAESCESLHAKLQESYAAWIKIPAARRYQAEKIHEYGVNNAKTVLEDFGGYYSGETTTVVGLAQKAEAFTDTRYGEKYSKGCKYSKTDATHTILLDPRGLLRLYNEPSLVATSRSEGLHLIALYPDGRAVWVKSKNKRIVSEDGFLAADPSGGIAHSTKSMEDANKALTRKLTAQKRERERAKRDDAEGYKSARRARLVARMCSSVTVTLKDAQEMGYCLPGIRAFQDKHGIGNAATMAELIHTRDPLATALALKIARNVSKNKLQSTT